MKIQVSFDSLEEFNSVFNHTLPTLNIEGEAKMQSPYMIKNKETGVYEPYDPEPGKPIEQKAEEPKAEEPKPEKKKKVKKEEAKAEEPKAEDAPKEEPKKDPDVTITDVKQLIHEKIADGKRQQMKDLLAEFGVSKITELAETHPEKLGDFYTMAKAVV